MSALAKIEGVAPAAPSLRIFDRIPGGHIVFAVHDHSCMPLVRPGEVLVIGDCPRMYPIEGQWFLIQWIRRPYHEWERPTVHQTVGIPREIKPDLWGYRPPNNRGPGVTYCGDFGYTWEMMTDRIRGPVVGIYRPGGA